MCGIIGAVNLEKNIVELGLKTIEYRGKDEQHIISKKTNNKNIIFGHNLHAIVNNIKQPLKKNNEFFTSNCEIYNWKSLTKAKNDSESIFFEISNSLKNQISSNLKTIKTTLKKFDGVYSCAYYKDDKIYLFRDIMGVKPLWFLHDKKYFMFASEKKAILEMIKELKKDQIYLDSNKITELNPRTILEYDISKNTLKTIRRDFFKIKPEIKKNENEILNELEKHYLNAIKKRIPDKKIKVGVLFSGGIDSTFIAYTLQKLKIPFTCYTAAVDDESKDLIWSKKIAKELGFKLKIAKPKQNLEKDIRQVCKIIESSNVVKVGVALPFFLATKLAKKDKVKVIFSGLGSEEIFAGYKRHEDSHYINKECRSGLLKMYERDLYRDDTITMYNQTELRLPLLDLSLIKYALRIPAKYKIKGEVKKYIFRQLALQLGLSEEFSQRKKLAAQYGSKFDKAIEKLAKKNNFKKKSEYLNQFLPNKNEKLGVLLSTGKDSCYATYIMNSKNYPISCLITLESENKASYMFQSAGVNLAHLQAKALNIPQITIKTQGQKEKELQDLDTAIKKAKKEYNIEGIVTGALFSNYQRNRIEKICDKNNLKIFSPLWHMQQEKEMENIIKLGFKFIIIKIAAYGLDKTWLGKQITLKDLEKLKKLNDNFGFNVAGEGGEFETFVTDMPLFKKKIKISGNIQMENENTGEFIITKATLENKDIIS